ncbi:hypothetical protein H9N25_18635 [Pedobacter riviphilus]|uniref:Uncharacterized protein n=1 Tax=Pedobacter riviphilus TaxID=2766984 RepID=A0ABX6TEJ3_9SPHI|nr:MULTISPECIES: hypothetical protein [Pedobacter]NII84054.1 hypothetical protein [Pedobacter sp. SG908]NMN39030.1 hypothetical protein [Pedobacter sp. SG918]QNR83924.1 hypothetical protein H9N25_18635 [Pedobacter riviphilus]
MSNISDPKPVKKGKRMDSDHNKLEESYTPVSKHKFEGWPILWILIAIFLISAILWYTGATPYLIKWIANK